MVWQYNYLTVRDMDSFKVRDFFWSLTVFKTRGCWSLAVYFTKECWSLKVLGTKECWSFRPGIVGPSQYFGQGVLVPDRVLNQGLYVLDILLDRVCIHWQYFLPGSIGTGLFFTASAHWADSVIESRCPDVCVSVFRSVTSRNTLFRRLWRPLIKERIPYIGLWWNN